MITNYYDFITESQLSLILEGDLTASSDFLARLKKTKKNKIGEVLYNLFKNEPWIDKDLPQNFINVSGEDEVSFLSDARFNKFIDDNDGYDVNPYLVKGRGTIKIGRFVSALLGDDRVKRHLPSLFTFNSKDLEDFVNLYKSSNIDDSKKFKLVKGDKIPKWYDEDRYVNKKGTLGGSCMRNVKSSFFDIYAENDKACQMLILIDKDDNLLGRALVWKMKESPCKAEYFMDRVYVSNDSDILRFVDYAKENKWLYKYKMTADFNESVLFYYNDTPVMGKVVVQLKKTNFDKYPFVDTLCFLNEKDKTLSNIGQADGELLGSTGGDTEVCSHCDGSGKNECIYCKNTDENCRYCKGIEKCPECSGILEYTIRKIKNGQYPEFKSLLT